METPETPDTPAWTGKLLQELRRIMGELKDIWDVIGFDQAEQSTRTSRVYTLLVGNMNDLKAGENALLKKYAKIVEERGMEFKRLNKGLDAGLPDFDETLTLVELDHLLKSHLESLKLELKSRQLRMKSLIDQEKDLCDRMCEEPSTVDVKAIPSKEVFTDMERRIRTLAQEKINREKTFQRLKSNLGKLLVELEHDNKSAFEVGVLSDLDDLFTLSRDNLDRLKRITCEYEQRVFENEKESLELQEKIQQLYNRLEVDPSECDTFLASVKGHTPSTLAKLHDEMNRLEAVKRENLALLINQERRQMETLWAQCIIGEQERNGFHQYAQEEYTEECLEAHENEVQRLETYYREWKEIFINLQKRERLWDRFMQLEARAADPTRLKSNRGGALLQEEKERKRVRKELPRVEKALEGVVLMWEEQLNRSFLVDGVRVTEYILNQWHAYHDERENQKEKKQTTRAKQVHSETRLGTKSLNASTKRQLQRNDTLRPTKLRKIGGETSSESSTSSVMTPSRGVLRERNHSRGRIQASPSNTTKASTTSNNTIDVSTYSTFMRELHHLDERENVRSSVLDYNSRLPHYRSSPRRPPPGLPKTPKTLPRAATRLSPRLHSGLRRSPRNTSHLRTPHTTSQFLPASSRSRSSRNISSYTPTSRLTRHNSLHPSSALGPAYKSPYSRTPRLKTPDRCTKLSFLI